MKNEYEKIDAFIGFVGSLDEAVKMLQDYKACGKRAYLYFNGHKLYSDTVTVNGAYLEVTGKTKAEYDKILKEQREIARREEAEHKAMIPELTKYYIKRGREILDPKYYDLWDKVVPARLNDLYKGMELDCCLEIVKALNDGCTLAEAKGIIDNQGHSGMSYSLVVAMVKSFCDRGVEFRKFVYEEE